MSKHLQRDLDTLQHDILTLASFVEEAIFRATKALRDRDSTLARRVIEGDVRIDDLENRVHDDCLKILALHQPVACDLRRITAVLLINTDLERIGDLAVDIADRAIALVGMPNLRIPDDLKRMADLASVMVRQSLDSFVFQDSQMARTVIEMDDTVDALNREIIQSLVSLMRSSAEQIDPALSLFSVVRHLERIADHATNIAEDVVYLVEGAVVRHRPRPEKAIITPPSTNRPRLAGGI